MLDRDQPDDALTFGMLLVMMLPIFLVILAIIFNTFRLLSHLRSSLTSSNRSDTSSSGFFNDPIYEAHMDSEALLKLTPNQQELYFQAKEYIKQNNYQKSEIPPWILNTIEERGVEAWNFVIPDTNSLQDINVASPVHIEVLNKTEITIKLDPNFSHSEKDIPPTKTIQTNFSIPTKGKTSIQDTYYIEYKLFNLPQPENVILSLGLSTLPYPSFVLPGRFPHSVSYDSNGFRRYNQPFGKLNKPGVTSEMNNSTPLNNETSNDLALNSLSTYPLVVPGASDGEPPFPKLEQGDVIGIGLRLKHKTVFFTRNGRRVSESKIGGHAHLPRDALIYPSLGVSFLKPSGEIKVDVNLGKAGYVFIEGNVKKWGLGNIDGNQPAPPKYERWNTDMILEATTDDEDPPTFDAFSDSAHDDSDQNLALNMNDAANNLNFINDNEESEDDVDNLTLQTLLPNYEEMLEGDIKQAMSERL